MHIEPGLVDGSKIFLSYATAAAALAYTGKVGFQTLVKDGPAALLLRSAIAIALVFCFFEVFPHHPVGVSEVHLILGTTLLLVFGLAPAAIGLAGGLLIQGLFFEPQDIPQYGMNVTTLLVPLFATSALARRIIPEKLAYVDIGYQQAFKLSVAYQGGIVVWVGFWALYGRGTGIENMSQIVSFGAAYMTVVLVEPLVDLGVLAAAKAWRRLQGSVFVERRLYGGV
ncbi:energy-coupling factor ABC transporter permease [Variovorax sp. NFACC27]|uniref:energy-coupling factor ABC transporter permease n=1 Tax=unclassified Variovorax TaxID=663243 RepID=UPI0008989FC4|nr:Cobalt uptake substrate-specific transmembrane region [Variovorax sp. NFACC28]SEG84637.1 Cobalt uptake substrate-specific transmembrane region [Variovorax sp. NFACC29]SFD18054.1 Cobalt uptake substrate-specific transmembrane region [Variovorax sp. NFACC26]SFG25387.1 Cobalt uptake substrate-specific transmembrane region [Variovorax sp. NFACC27]